MKLQPLLESFDPRRFLLHVQQLLVDEYPRADVELDSKHAERFSLKVEYADIAPITFELYVEEITRVWYRELTSENHKLYHAPFDVRVTPQDVFDSIEIFIKDEFKWIATSELYSQYDENDIHSVAQRWIDDEVIKLFKYLGTGRLKKAADVHVVIDDVLDDKGLQKLETRYNSMLITSKKHPFNSAVDRDNGEHEIYILADLE